MRIKMIISLSLLMLLNVITYTAAKSKGTTQKGGASYYAKKFHNKRTASGITYDKNSYTCAHRTYPFGTKLLVRNPKNNREVVVEVNDRGPFKRGRVVDLSYIAAADLDIIQDGIAPVEVSEYIEPEAVDMMEDGEVIFNTAPPDSSEYSTVLINKE